MTNPQADPVAWMPPDPGDRGILIDRLRAMADFLADHPEVPLSPYAGVDVNYFTDDPADAVRVMDAIGGEWAISEGPTLITHEYPGSAHPGRWAVTYQCHVRK